MTTATTEPKRLHEHIAAALVESARRVLADNPDPALRDVLAQRVQSILDGTDPRRIYARLDIDRRRPNGTPDLRALTVTVWLVDDTDQHAAPALLTRVRARDLVDTSGQPVDARTSARELLWQHGHGIPDSPAGLDR